MILPPVSLMCQSFILSIYPGRDEENRRTHRCKELIISKTENHYFGNNDIHYDDDINSKLIVAHRNTPGNIPSKPPDGRFF